jgi:Tol biopolymer transport system component
VRSETSALAWWTPAGIVETGRELPDLRNPALAPDGRRLAGVLAAADRDDLWIAEIERGAATRVTHGGINASPVWAADGRTLFHAARTSGVFEIWSRRPDENAGTRLYGSDRHSLPAAASPDGRTLAFVRAADDTHADIWLLALGTGAARPLVAGSFDELAPAFSPRSDMLAYQSAESGRWEVYVRRLDADARALVSTEGGVRPYWSADGSAVYFQSGDRLMRAAINATGAGLTAGANEQVATLGGRAIAGMAAGRLLLTRPVDPPPAAIVGLEWIRDIRQMLGPPQAVLPR